MPDQDPTVVLGMSGVSADEYAFLKAIQRSERFDRRAARYTVILRSNVVRRAILSFAKLSEDPRGLRVCGVLLEGDLDLSYATVDVPISFEECEFNGCLDASYASLRTLDLSRCQLLNGADTRLKLDQAQIDGALNLGGIQISTRSHTSAALDASRSHVTGQLDLTGATVSNDSPSGTVETASAIAAEGLVVDNDVSMEGLTATSRGKHLVKLA